MPEDLQKNPFNFVFCKEESRQVKVAFNTRIMTEYLNKRCDMQTVHTKCHILYAKYEPGNYCYILYQLGSSLFTGLLQWRTESKENTPESAWQIHEIGMKIYQFENDPALPGLKTIINEQLVTDILTETLSECQSKKNRILRCRVTPVRYRPGLRCTLRIDAWLRDVETGDFKKYSLFAKVYNTLAEMKAAYKAMRLLYDSGVAQRGNMVFARIVNASPDTRTILQETVKGKQLDNYLGGMKRNVSTGDHRGRVGVLRSAAALAAIHTSALKLDAQRPILHELEDFISRSTKAISVKPSVGIALLQLAETLVVLYDKLADFGIETSLIHGDCKPSQFMVNNETLALLDLDHCGMADPAADIGTYLATLRQLGVWQSLRACNSSSAQLRKTWLRDLENRFLEEYCRIANKDVNFQRRVIWYEAVGLLRKALRAFSRSFHSPMPSAQVMEAWECIKALQSCLK